MLCAEFIGIIQAVGSVEQVQVRSMKKRDFEWVSVLVATFDIFIFVL